MKKNKLLLIFLSLVVLFSMTGCGKDNDAEKESDGKKEEVKEEVNVEPKYLTDGMELYDNVEQLNGNIKDIFLDMHRVITKDNKIYDYSVHIEEISKLDVDVNKILNNHTDSTTMTSLVENKDGSISFISYDGVIEYTVTLDNIIFATSSYVFTLEGGYLYSYKISDGQLGTKERVYLKEYNDNKNFYDGKVVVEYIPSSTWMYFKLDNGDIRLYSNHYERLKKDNRMYFSTVSGEKQYLPGKELSKVFYYDVLVQEIFVTKEKNTSIYYYDYSTYGGEVQCLAEKGNVLCYESAKKEIPLPQGYTVDDIEKVMQDSWNKYDLNIITKDGKVYYYNNNEWSELEFLSQLYKENHIIELKLEYGSMLVLCDDGYLYEYNF